ncbi:MAG: hypothetical protein EA376_12080 [Phycisphaeraceae bacterium]|nr:MAG: hypothetical protein EA376_12080 [Phycisphaeraceae bacterium]
MVAEAAAAATLTFDTDADRMSPSLSREQLVDRIRRVNPTATPSRLEGFTVDALRLYLDHLAVTLTPRAAGAGWLRPGDTPAIMTREPRD